MDIFLPTTPTSSSSAELTRSLTGPDPAGPPLCSGTLTGQTLGTTMHQVYCTQSNSFGLFHLYDKESLPVHDPEDTSDDIAGS